MTTPATTPSPSRNRPGLLWPVILIVTGLVLLGNTLGLIPWSVWNTLGLLWPLLLILLGLEVLFGHRSGIIRWLLGGIYLLILGGAVVLALAGVTPFGNVQETRAEAVAQPLDPAATSLQVSLSSGVGNFDIRGGAPAGQAVTGTMQLRSGEELRQSTQTASGVQTVTLQVRGQSGPVFGFPAVGSVGGSELQVASSTPLSLSLNGGVGNTNVDLTGTALSALSVNGGVGNTTVQLPAPPASGQRVSIDGGVGAVTVTLPPGVTVQARIDSGIGPVNLPAAWTRTGSTARSPGAESGAQVTLTVDGGVGPITILQ